MNKIFLVAVVALLGLTSSAHAAMIDVTLGSTGSSVTYSTGGVLTPDIQLLSLGSRLAMNGAVIVNPAVTFPGEFIRPSGPLLGHNYVAVFGGAGGSGSAAITLAPGDNVFGFTWGTIDSYNTLVLTDSRGDTYTITGSEILSQIAGSVPGTTQTNISFYDPYGTILSADLISSQNSFEAGNFEEKRISSVPLPASLPLFLLALAGLFIVAQRKVGKASKSI